MDPKIADSRNLVLCENTSNIILEVKASESVPPAAPAVVKKIKWRLLAGDMTLTSVAILDDMFDSVEKEGYIDFDAARYAKENGLNIPRKVEGPWMKSVTLPGRTSSHSMLLSDDPDFKEFIDTGVANGVFSVTPITDSEQVRSVLRQRFTKK